VTSPGSCLHPPPCYEVLNKTLARSAKCGKNRGSSTPAELDFFLTKTRTFRQLPNGRFSTKLNFISFGHDRLKNPIEDFRKGFSKNSRPFRGHLPPINFKIEGGQTGTLLWPAYSSEEDALQRDTVHSTGALKFTNIRIFAYCSRTKRPKSTFRWPPCSPLQC